MLIKGTKKYNRRHNCERTAPPEFGKMINGQGIGAVSKLRYGICFMGFNGCEVISVHNALVYLGRPMPLMDIAFYMERFRLLLGFFGCNVFKVGKALRHFGVDCVRSRNADDSHAFIITFWTKTPFLSQIHTVFCVRTENGIAVYNRYNNDPTVNICRSTDEIAKKGRIIAVYTIEKTADTNISKEDDI